VENRGKTMFFVGRAGRGKRLRWAWTFKGNQTNRRLISFKVSRVPFSSGIFIKSPVSVDLAKNNLLLFKQIQFSRKAGGGLPDFLENSSLKSARAKRLR
jgi:hypothetical protein